MTTITASAGLVNLLAPLPSPRQFDLLAAARLVDPTSNRWLAGAWVGGDVPGPAHTHDPCSTGTNRVKASAGDIPDSQNFRFVVYQPGFCTASSVGPDPTWLKDRLRLIFQVFEGAAAERVLVSGDGHLDLGPFLGDDNMKALNSGTPVTPLRAMELLEDEIAERGTGMIHCTPATFTAWEHDYVVESDLKTGKAFTGLGTPVAVGAGYIDAIPTGFTLPSGDAWAFASGPIEIYRDPDVTVIPGNYAESIDRSMNDVMFYAERPYLFNWIPRQSPSDDAQIQAGVLIDLTP